MDQLPNVGEGESARENCSLLLEESGSNSGWKLTGTKFTDGVNRPEELRIRLNYVMSLWDKAGPGGVLPAFGAKMAEISLIHVEILTRLVEDVLSESGIQTKGNQARGIHVPPGQRQWNERGKKQRFQDSVTDSLDLNETERELCRRYNFHVNFASATEEDRKLLRKFKRQFGSEPSVEFLLSVRPHELMSHSGWGRKSVSWLKAFQRKLKHNLSEFREEDLFKFRETGPALLPWKLCPVDLKMIDSSLQYDLDHILSEVGNELRSIAMARWAFRCEHRSLEEIGRQFKKTRERIRQLEGGFNEIVVSCLRISPPVLKYNLNKYRNEDLTKLLPRFSACFTKKRYFYEFLDKCSGAGKGESFLDSQWVDLSLVSFSELESWLAEFSGPYSPKQVTEEIGRRYQLSKVQSVMVLNHFASQGKLILRNNQWYPGALHKNIAVAHILLDQPDGLHWTCIYQKIRERNFLKLENSEDRLDASFTENPRIYLIGQGTYCHRKFLGIDTSLQDEILSVAKEFLETKKERTANLQAVWSWVNKRIPCDYFALRYIVAQSGQENGFYFDGASRNDTLSLTPHG